MRKMESCCGAWPVDDAIALAMTWPSYSRPRVGWDLSEWSEVKLHRLREPPLSLPLPRSTGHKLQTLHVLKVLSEEAHGPNTRKGPRGNSAMASAAVISSSPPLTAESSRSAQRAMDQDDEDDLLAIRLTAAGDTTELERDYADDLEDLVACVHSTRSVPLPAGTLTNSCNTQPVFRLLSI